MNKLLSFIFILMMFLFTYSSVFAGDVEIPESWQQSARTLPYDYSSTKSIPIYLSITDEISTKYGIIEGQILNFRVIKTISYNGKVLIKEGEIVKGKVETVITSGMNGFPAEIIVDEFQLPDINNSQLISEYIKKGQNRCFWVYPLKWSLTLIPFVGSLTNLIMGGHARIKTTDIITVYYYPEWL